MIDMVKLLKAHEFCKVNASCVGCPYDEECSTRDFAIENDTIAILREQEPRVMMLEEVKSHEVVFMEDYTNSEDGVEPIIRPAIIVEAKNGGLLILDSAYWDDGFVFNAEEDYGKTWRCWTARPIDEQRKAVKWDA